MMYEIEKIAGIIKTAAIDILMPLFANVERQYKLDGSIVTEADNAMQDYIEKELSGLYPDTLMLAEEMSRDEQQKAISKGVACWCLDPLDGTNNFAAGVPYFSVSLALMVDKKIVLGVVYDPVRDELFSATELQGARMNGSSLTLVNSGLKLKQALAIIDLKRLDNKLATRIVTASPFSSQRSFGSVALDWCWLAAQRSHVYLHGSSNIWDYSAGQYIFEKAGGHSSTLSGEPVYRNELSKRSAVAAVDESLFKEWRSWLLQSE